MWNKTITLYNKFEDKITGQTHWYRHVLKNCFVKQTKYKVNVGNTQTATDDNIIRIPQQKNFVPSFEWSEISTDLKRNYITLQGGDLIILGDAPDEIDEYTQGQRSNDIIAKYEALGSLFISSVNINTDLPGPHYLVRGK